MEWTPRHFAAFVQVAPPEAARRLEHMPRELYVERLVQPTCCNRSSHISRQQLRVRGTSETCSSSLASYFCFSSRPVILVSASPLASTPHSPTCISTYLIPLLCLTLTCFPLGFAFALLLAACIELVVQSSLCRFAAANSTRQTSACTLHAHQTGYLTLPYTPCCTASQNKPWFGQVQTTSRRLHTASGES